MLFLLLLKRAAHRNHYQAPDFNGLNGGIQCRLKPLEPFVAKRSILHGVLSASRDVFGMRLRGAGLWRFEAHQIRTTPLGDVRVKPPPEGLHQDRVDCVMTLLIAKSGVYDGVTTTADLGDGTIAPFTLTDPSENMTPDGSLLKQCVRSI